MCFKEGKINNIPKLTNMILNERDPQVNVTVRMDHAFLFTLMFAKVNLICVSVAARTATQREARPNSYSGYS